MLCSRVLLPIISLSLFSTACAKSSREDAKPTPLTKITYDEYFADNYFLEDQACQTSGASAAFGNVSVQRWTGTGTSPVNFGFDQQAQSSDSLQSNALLGTRYGLHQRTSCTQNSDSVECSKYIEVVSASSKLRVCRPDGGYQRTSIEGVALTSLASLTEAYRFFNSLAGRPGDVARFNLLVLPIVEKQIAATGSSPAKRSIVTDNMAYAPSFMNQPTFVIFPKGRDSVKKGLWRNMNLWELPWGLAHEFGHHVFRTFTNQGTDSSATDEDLDVASMLPIIKVTDGEDGELPAGEGVALAAQGATVENEVSAVNEGYADLFAHYSFKNSSAGLNGVDCFQQNRDLSAAEFSSGDKKALTAQVLNEFLSQIPTRNADGCNTPAFTDVHAIGAIIAHGIDRLFTAAVGTADDAPQRKALMLITWAQRIHALGNTLSLETMVKEGVATAAGSSRALTSVQCQAVRDVFPQWSSDWLAGGTSGFTCR